MRELLKLAGAIIGVVMFLAVVIGFGLTTRSTAEDAEAAAKKAQVQADQNKAVIDELSGIHSAIKNKEEARRELLKQLCDARELTGDDYCAEVQ